MTSEDLPPKDPSQDSLAGINEPPEDDSSQVVIKDYQAASRHLSSSLSRLLGIIILTLSCMVLVLVVTSFFVHPGQPDETLLLIEQIIGFALFILATFTGMILLLQAKRKEKGKQSYVLEPIATTDTSEPSEESEMKP